MLVHALVHQLHDTRRSSSEKSSLPRRGYGLARSPYPAPASELPAREQALEEPGTEAVLTIVLARAFAPPCSDSDDTTTTRREQLRSSHRRGKAAHAATNLLEAPKRWAHPGGQTKSIWRFPSPAVSYSSFV